MKSTLSPVAFAVYGLVSVLAVACGSKDDDAGDSTSSGGSESASGGSGGSSTASGGSASGGGTSTATGGASSTDDKWAQARIDCVDKINAFRATEGLPPYERWTENESCADEQAAKDSTSGAHANFGDCGEWGQNTCPGWGSLEDVLTGCLQSMWDEGPGEPFSEHGHYLNMSSTSYTKVACGFSEMPNGDIWHSQDFK